MLGKFGVLSTGQIGREFFAGVAAATVRRRLRILERAQLIYRVRGLDDGGVGWTLTRQASEAIGANLNSRAFNRSTLNHDVVLSDVRLSLEKAGISHNWVAEHTLKSHRTNKSLAEDRFVPDALFSVTAEAKPRAIALELELHGKNQKRYEKILTRYLRMKSIWAVWYLVPSASLGKLLEAVWRKLNRATRNDLLMWSLLDEILTNPTEAWVNSEHFRYRLKDIILTHDSLMTNEPKPAPGGALPGSNGKEGGQGASPTGQF